MSLKKPRVVVAGQIPPPIGGQNIMVQKALTQFTTSNCCEVVHLPFFFTPHVGRARTFDLRKALELLKVIMRLVRIRLSGPIDLILYPSGGPQTAPIIRDILLLPWILLFSRRLIVHFHAAGIADRLERDRPSIRSRLLLFLYRRAAAAIVMTDFNRRDPEALGIKRILLLPLRIEDDFDQTLVHRDEPNRLRLLYVGHLCPDKGTPELLHAFASLRNQHPELELELVGECLAPFTDLVLHQLVDRLAIGPYVRISGVLKGKAKAVAFGRADLFVFPSVAPYESFGLVLAEAMAWKLPIVASNWRGNSDVLTVRAGAVCFSVTSALTDDLTAALQTAIKDRVQWLKWGETNRAIFKERYRETKESGWLSEPILSLSALGQESDFLSKSRQD